jgi:hypothetical protein
MYNWLPNNNIEHILIVVTLFPSSTFIIPPIASMICPKYRHNWLCYSNWIKNVSLILVRLLFVYGVVNNCIIMYSVSYI